MCRPYRLAGKGYIQPSRSSARAVFLREVHCASGTRSARNGRRDGGEGRGEGGVVCVCLVGCVGGGEGVLKSILLAFETFSRYDFIKENSYYRSHIAHSRFTVQG